MSKQENIVLDGVVEDSCKGILTVFNEKAQLLAHCHISGKMKRNRIKVVVGDSVRFEVSPADGDIVKRGTITHRLKGKDGK